jgi:hypothetical protein
MALAAACSIESMFNIGVKFYDVTRDGKHRIEGILTAAQN